MNFAELVPRKAPARTYVFLRIRKQLSRNALNPRTVCHDAAST